MLRRVLRRAPLLASLASLVAAASSMPRIVPLSLRRAQHVLHAWGRPPVAMPAASSTVELGAVSLMRGDDVRAVALLERRTNQQLHLCRLECNYGESGTLLLKALTHAAPTLTHAVEPRWSIGLAYFRAAAKKTDGP